MRLMKESSKDKCRAAKQDETIYPTKCQKTVMEIKVRHCTCLPKEEDEDYLNWDKRLPWKHEQKGKESK